MVALGEEKFFTALKRKEVPRFEEKGSFFWFIPDSLSDTFDNLFRPSISKLFHTLGFDYFAKNTKISLFCLILLNPALIIVGLFVFNTLQDLIDPAPQLIPVQQKQPAH